MNEWLLYIDIYISIYLSLSMSSTPAAYTVNCTLEQTEGMAVFEAIPSIVEEVVHSPNPG